MVRFIITFLSITIIVFLQIRLINYSIKPLNSPAALLVTQ
jgi:hypothetical protein